MKKRIRKLILHLFGRVDCAEHGVSKRAILPFDVCRTCERIGFVAAKRSLEELKRNREREQRIEEIAAGTALGIKRAQDDIIRDIQIAMGK